MKIETLKDRIQKAEAKLIKSNSTLERHKKQLIKKSKILTDKNINLINYNKYDDSIRQTETYWDLCDYESKLEDIENTEKKIAETTATLEKLNKQLEDQLAKEENTNNLIPEVLNIFLENWKKKAYDFYINLATEYIEIDTKEYEITREELEALQIEKYDRKKHETILIPKFTAEEIENILNNNIASYEKSNITNSIRRRHINTFKKSHFASDLYVLDKIIDYNTIDTTKLNKILDDEVKAKKEQFISRIKEVIGEIKDLSNLHISDKGEINGIAKGIKCNAKIETITAGGYNIQCWHYRVLVNTIK